MKRFCLFLFFLFVGIVSFFSHANPISSDELDDINKQINELTKALNQSKAATAPLESQLTSMQKQIAGIKASVATIERDVAEKEKNIVKGYKELAEKEKVLSLAISNYYIKSYYNSPLLALLSVSSATEITQVLAYQRATTDRDKAIITNLALSIDDLENKKQSLESEKTRLTQIKASLDQQSAELDKIVSGAKAYQGTLSGQIAQLSAKQKEILGQRLASLNISRSAASIGACADDRNIDPGFGNAFAFFTYGAPHRVGMNQFGAKGRAEAGQGRDDILRAYYTNFETVKWDTNIKIKVQGYGEFPLEDYVLRIYEVPESWPMAALESQAIAARSFALAYTNNGSGEICTSESCQVFKPDPKTGPWVQAVKNTEGLVMTSGGSPIKAWYASTHGGYIFTSAEVWGGGTAYTKHATDTTTGSAGSFEDLQSNAYDRSSPWFYCDWGSRAQYNKTAWLKSEEVADIANTAKLAEVSNQDTNVTKHLLQLDKSNPDGNWDENKVREELQSRGVTPLTSVSNVSVSVDFSSGRTTNITVSGNTSMSFSADFFKTYFNLRAPATIQIVGPLYNVERR